MTKPFAILILPTREFLGESRGSIWTQTYPYLQPEEDIDKFLTEINRNQNRLGLLDLAPTNLKKVEIQYQVIHPLTNPVVVFKTEDSKKQYVRNTQKGGEFTPDKTLATRFEETAVQQHIGFISGWANIPLEYESADIQPTQPISTHETLHTP